MLILEKWLICRLIFRSTLQSKSQTNRDYSFHQKPKTPRVLSLFFLFPNAPSRVLGTVNTLSVLISTACLTKVSFVKETLYFSKRSGSLEFYLNGANT